MNPVAKTNDPVKRLMISETHYSISNYHLRLVEVGQEKFGGNAGFAICGSKIGWDTRIPLKGYGEKDHVGSKFCKFCLEIARQQKMKGYEELVSF